jgi:hypothetical protein
MSFKFGGWAISKECFNYIRKLLPDGKIILELGSGEGTDMLSKHYKMYSIENQKEWIDRYDSTYIYAPIKNYNIGEDNNWWYKGSTEISFIAPEGIPSEDGNKVQSSWFDPQQIKYNLPKDYDLILIDGPNGKYGRGGFYVYLDWFKKDVPIIVDDVKRDAERILMEKVSKKLDRNYIILDDEVTGVIL